jgi:hypothetical protein
MPLSHHPVVVEVEVVLDSQRLEAQFLLLLSLVVLEAEEQEHYFLHLHGTEAVAATTFDHPPVYFGLDTQIHIRTQ